MRTRERNPKKRKMEKAKDHNFYYAVNTHQAR